MREIETKRSHAAVFQRPPLVYFSIEPLPLSANPVYSFLTYFSLLRMKVTLIHNPDAGDNQQPSADALFELISRAGHTPSYHSSKDKNWQSALEKPCDVVAVAGATALWGWLPSIPQLGQDTVRLLALAGRRRPRRLRPRPRGKAGPPRPPGHVGDPQRPTDPARVPEL